MKCKECKYKKDVSNGTDIERAICLYSDSWFPVHVEDNCHFIPEKKGLTCGDCARLDDDMACIGCFPDESAINDGILCAGFEDKKEKEFRDILLYWKSHDYYDRERIIALIDQFEKEYTDITDDEI